MITKEELVILLNGIEYPFSISDEIKNKMQGTDLVIVYGYSDDGMEFRGAIQDGIDCYDGGTAYLNSKGLLHNGCEDDECPYFKKLKKSAAIIEALWCKEENISWTYKTDIKHVTFDIGEDGGLFCRGIIFNLSDVKP